MEPSRTASPGTMFEALPEDMMPKVTMSPLPSCSSFETKRCPARRISDATAAADTPSYGLAPWLSFPWTSILNTEAPMALPWL